jgi:hypothetical protein
MNQSGSCWVDRHGYRPPDDTFAGIDDTTGDYLVGAGVDMPVGNLLVRGNVDTISFDTLRVTVGVGFAY